MAHVVIIGGGVSGLSAAYYLSKYAKHARNIVKKITLIEGAKDAGGWMQSTSCPDGAVFEHGPRSLRWAGHAGMNTLELAEDLGLDNDIIKVARGHPAMKERFLFVNGERIVLPVNGILALLFPRPPFNQSLALTAVKELFTKSGHYWEDETIHSFISRRFGRQLAEYAADPVMRGVYAGDVRKLSIKSVAPELFKMEQDHGSVIWGALRRKKENVDSKSNLVRRAREERWGIWSLKKGIQQLPDRMVQVLKEEDNVDIVTGTRCTGMSFDDRKVKVSTDKGTYEADHIFSTVFAPNTGILLPTEHNELGDKLGKIEAGTVAVVNLEYNEKVLKTPGFGHLVPSSEPAKNLGVVYDSCCFPEHDRKDKVSERFTVMLGGTWFNELFGPQKFAKESVILDAALESMRDQLKVTIDPERTFVKIQKDCIPQYNVGHAKNLSEIWTYLTDRRLPLSLLGSSYKGVSINDCIYNAKLEVKRVFPELFQGR